MNILKYKNVTLSEAKNRLFTIWIAGFIICFVLTLIQTIMGKYDELYMNVMDWFGPLIFPTLTLMIGVLIATNNQPVDMKKVADPTVFKTAEICSILFLSLILVVFLLEPFVHQTPFELMSRVKVFFTFFNGLLTGLIGYFFIKK